MDVADFLPSYPLPSDPNLVRELYHKAEFYELSDHDVPRPTQKFQLMHHQQIVARFLSPYTAYDELLLYAVMGAGKTATAIAAAESLNASPLFPRTLVLLKNQDLISIFVDQIIKSTGDKYHVDVEMVESNSLEQHQKRLAMAQREKVKIHYQFKSFTQFYNDNVTRREARPNDWFRKFENTLIVIDEVHNLISDQAYSIVFDLLHRLQHRKILLMTGTPMGDSVVDIADVMNLILPLNAQLPRGDAFISRYFVGNTLPSSSVDALAQSFHGRIAYIRSVGNVARSEIDGQYVAAIPEFRFVLSPMSAFQETAFAKAVALDVQPQVPARGVIPANRIEDRFQQYRESNQRMAEAQRNMMRNAARQASLFVFPNGEFQTTGFEEYFDPQKGGQPTQAWNLLTRKLRTREQQLAWIRTHSAKYAAIIEYILAHPREKIFVFLESIREGGAVVLGHCLVLVGFSSYRSKIAPTHESHRFAILSSSVQSIPVKRIVDQFNSAENQDGSRLQILIGGMQASEAYTFKNVGSIHIASPHWNWTIMDQAIGRALRIGSHSNPDTTVVKIFLHAAVPAQFDPTQIPSNLSDLPIDLYVYATATQKDVYIQRMQRVILETAVDCPLQHQRNRIRGGVSGSRECFYGDCTVACYDHVGPYLLRADELDTSTKDLYYPDVTMNDVDALLETRFGPYAYNRTIPMELQTIPILHHTNTHVYTTQDPHQQWQYLQANGMELLLTSLPFVNVGQEGARYVKQPVLNVSRSKESIAQQLQMDIVERMCVHMRQESLLYEDWQRFMQQLPRKLHIAFLENAIAIEKEWQQRGQLQTLPRNTTYVLRYFDKVVYHMQIFDRQRNEFVQRTYHTLSLSQNEFRAWENGQWRTQNGDLSSFLQTKGFLSVRGARQEVEMYPSFNPIGYYIRQSIYLSAPEEARFIAMPQTREELGKLVNRPGMACKSVNKNTLLEFLEQNQFMGIDDGGDHRNVSEKIVQLARRHGMVMYYG